MSRPLACGVLFVLLHIAPLNLAPAAAQEPERWGDELPPAPEFSAMPVAVSTATIATTAGAMRHFFIR